ncbi:cytoplasmic dynein 2 light intermediate chain 1 isoform X2 [Folsomia candida]|uniref:cytoplasmic dynein 2 light intermediate chain 1 isoform X2 n=1 Tax=Folsomia candida TaxID=158441 RepID=UPI001604EF3F|nr:cytoplasmic dynein 2 light intermediate chain 1 isoform X2 [Folsomia candida]
MAEDPTLPVVAELKDLTSKEKTTSQDPAEKGQLKNDPSKKEVVVDIYNVERKLTREEVRKALDVKLIPEPLVFKKAEVVSHPPRQTRMADFTTIYLLGSASSTEVPKPTVALDYTFARRTVQNAEGSQFPIKEVCNIWELGGDAFRLAELVETPVVTNRGLDKMAIFLVLDLSEPLKLWPTLDTAVKQLTRGITQALANNMRNSKKGDMTKKLEENIVKRLGDNLSDKPYLEPFPLPIVIIGTKFDLFQNFEPERRKQVSRILRLASHRLGASLNYFSKNEVAHNRRVRELFTHYAFGTRFPKDVCHDFNKGLLIPHGGDSYNQIWSGANPGQFTFDYFKHLYESQIGKSEDYKNDAADEANFREPQIDSQRNILLEELRMMEESFTEFSNQGHQIKIIK